MKTGLLSLRGNLERWILIRRRRRCVEEHHDRGPIEPRSRRDRAAIVIPGGRNHLPELWKVALEASDRGSTHDRGPITVDRGPIVVQTWRSWRLILRKIRHTFGSYNAAQGNRSLDAANLRPHPPLQPTIPGQFLSLKTHVPLLCS